MLDELNKQLEDNLNLIDQLEIKREALTDSSSVEEGNAIREDIKALKDTVWEIRAKIKTLETAERDKIREAKEIADRSHLNSWEELPDAWKVVKNTPKIAFLKKFLP